MGTKRRRRARRISGLRKRKNVKENDDDGETSYGFAEKATFLKPLWWHLIFSSP